MGLFDKAKIVADIAEISARIYGIIRDKGKEAADRDAEIKELKAKLAAAERKLGNKEETS